MTTPTHQSVFRPSISVYKPTINGAFYTPEGLMVGLITDQVSGYNHEIQALGGYWSAGFTIQDRKSRIEDWLENGLGRHIVIHDETMKVVWAGFVDRVIATLGAASIERGPLMDVTNRLDVVFSPTDTDTNPATQWASFRTGALDDTDSQDKYGILETIMNAGTCTETEAEEARNQYLEERKEPKTTQTVTLGATSGPSVTIECLGYVHLFNRYVYNQLVNTGEQDLDAQLQDIISAQLNSIIDTGYEEIVANTLQVARYANDDATAWDLIKGLLTLGDASDYRYLFGIYADEVPVYEQAPTELEYQMRIADPQQRIETIAGNTVMPWNVLPGKWLLISDLFPGKSLPAFAGFSSQALREDPRAMFIESVSYTAPWGLTLQGGDTDKFSQKLARFGLAGIGG